LAKRYDEACADRDRLAAACLAVDRELSPGAARAGELTGAHFEVAQALAATEWPGYRQGRAQEPGLCERCHTEPKAVGYSMCGACAWSPLRTVEPPASAPAGPAPTPTPDPAPNGAQEAAQQPTAWDLLGIDPNATRSVRAGAQQEIEALQRQHLADRIRHIADDHKRLIAWLNSHRLGYAGPGAVLYALAADLEAGKLTGEGRADGR
ncbi:MAG TPA: hypothetical protein VFY14_15685, partial [Streptomyces sp.]|nr:hypothetical protein [Streptomyces sp.]